MIGRSHMRRCAAGALASVLVVLGAVGEAAAQDDEAFGVDLEITIPLEINEQNPVDFGVITRPHDNPTTIQLEYNSGNLAILNGENVVAENGQAGQYHVWGPQGEEVLVQATIEDFDATGITVEETHLESEDNTTVVEFNGPGGGNGDKPPGPPMNIGGIVTIAPDAAPGQHQTEFYITATYQ